MVSKNPQMTQIRLKLSSFGADLGDLPFEKTMSVPEIAPGSAAHLKLVTEFYQAEPRPSVFASAYRDLLAHRYNLLVPEDARVLEVGCGAGELLHRIHASRQNRGRSLSRTGCPRQGTLSAS